MKHIVFIARKEEEAARSTLGPCFEARQCQSAQALDGGVQELRQTSRPATLSAHVR